VTAAERRGRVGVLIPVVFDEYFARLLHGVADAVYEHRLRLVLAPSRQEHAREVELFNELRDETSGAVVILPEQSSAELLAALADGYPLVVCDPRLPLDVRIPSVASANAAGAEQAMRHLLELGHRRIAAITGPPGWVATEERRRGYRAALAEADIPFDPALELEGEFDFEPGEQATAALFELQRPPTAIVGFDDSAYSRVVHPALTTVRQPLAETGATAVDLLVRLMRQEPVNTLHLEKFTRLVVRDTTSTPRAESRPS
jgi:LacI family transcriptional regulator